MNESTSAREGDRRSDRRRRLESIGLTPRQLALGLGLNAAAIILAILFAAGWHYATTPDPTRYDGRLEDVRLADDGAGCVAVARIDGIDYELGPRVDYRGLDAGDRVRFQFDRAGKAIASLEADRG